MSDLRQLAEKADDGLWYSQLSLAGRGPIYARDTAFIAACSPERILAMLDVIDTARKVLVLEHSPQMTAPQNREAYERARAFREALARLGALDKEET